jgi:hypothetical protein
MSEQETEYRCEKCGETFEDADSLTEHNKIHEASRPNKPDEPPVDQPEEHEVQKPVEPPSVAPGQQPPTR